MKTVTIDNLAECTEQEVFDFVANHLLTQNMKSISTDQECVYRGLNGLTCAAGCLIPNGSYNSDLEGNSWNTLTFKGLIPSSHSDFINKLQTIHDVYPVREWHHYLGSLAIKHNLQFNF